MPIDFIAITVYKQGMKALRTVAALCVLIAVLLSFGCVKHTHIVIESRRVGDYFCSFYEDGTVDITQYLGADEELKLPNEIEGHKVIGFGMKAFDGCEGLRAAYIPPTVTSLPAKLFDSCPALERIYIPASVRRIGKNAVHECPEFTTVLFGGTEQQWESIDVGSVPWTDNYVLINSEIICNYSFGN